MRLGNLNIVVEAMLVQQFADFLQVSQTLVCRLKNTCFQNNLLILFMAYLGNLYFLEVTNGSCNYLHIILVWLPPFFTGKV
jgi:hypothetical protein